MREFVYACDEGFSAIVKLTMVQYILPKLRNRWGDAELRKQADRRPTRFYRDIHGRAVRGEITDAELVDARATIEDFLDLLERTLAPGPWIVGEQFSLAEIAIAPYMFRLAALGADQFWSADRRPLVSEWYRRLSARPAFQTAVSWPDETRRSFTASLTFTRGFLGDCQKSSILHRRRILRSLVGGKRAFPICLDVTASAAKRTFAPQRQGSHHAGAFVPRSSTSHSV